MVRWCPCCRSNTTLPPSLLFLPRQVCVVALKKGQLQVLSNAWDRDLGGRDLDAVLFEHFVT